MIISLSIPQFQKEKNKNHYDKRQRLPHDIHVNTAVWHDKSIHYARFLILKKLRNLNESVKEDVVKSVIIVASALTKNVLNCELPYWL